MYHREKKGIYNWGELQNNDDAKEKEEKIGEAAFLGKCV